MTIEEAIINLEDGMYWLKNNEEPELLKRIRFNETVETALSALRAQQEAERNEPLTLEELREIIGQPVFLVTGEVSIGEQLIGEWEILTSYGPEDDHFTITRRCKAFLGKNYGLTWLAYRRPTVGEGAET